MPVKTAKIHEIDRPITAANAQNTICAVDADIRLIIAPNPKMNASGANMMTHLIGDVNIA